MWFLWRDEPKQITDWFAPASGKLFWKDRTSECCALKYEAEKSSFVLLRKAMKLHGK